MKTKLKGFTIKRIDKTVEPDKEGKYPKKIFNCRVNTAFTNDHKMLF